MSAAPPLVKPPQEPVDGRPDGAQARSEHTPVNTQWAPTNLNGGPHPQG